MQVVVWIILILVIIFLIWLLRKWIKRLIFILILLALAFLIYGIFNPSGAARLWYNIRTFPQRMAGWMGSGEEFLDYDNYKLNLSEVGDKIGLEEDEDNSDYELDIDDEYGNDDKAQSKNGKNTVRNVEDEEDIDDNRDTHKTIKAFPKLVRFVEFPELEQRDNVEESGPLTGYSKSDLLGVVNKYIEENLSDDTDILVTVEYGEDNSTPQKIILQTQHKTLGKENSIYLFDGSQEDTSEDDEWVEIDATSYDDSVILGDQAKNSTQSVRKTTSTSLTQKEQKETEEIFSVLF